MRDLHNNIKAEVALNVSAISTNTTTAGNIIDMRGFGAAEFILLSGALTDGAYTALVQEGDAANLSDAASVADADLLGTEAAASLALTDDNAVKKIGYIGNKRYLKGVATPTGTHTVGTPIGIIALRGASAYRPVVTP